MLKSICGAIVFVFLVITIHTSPAEAKCSNNERCISTTLKKITARQSYSTKGLIVGKHGAKRFSKNYKSSRKYARLSKRHSASAATRSHVMALIKKMAPGYGVPTWFALRIAHVESGYNPNARGSVGEIGVFQLKCTTAKGIGYRGSCKGLYNASTNVQYGLRHLSLAIKSSRGNLKLAASKHNGGLGRKKLVKKYVNRVF